MSEGDQIPKAPRKSRAKKVFFVLFAFNACGLLAAIAWFRYQFPYGATHACSKVLGMELQSYAEDHGHWLPHGEVTPEASLGLLYSTNVQEASGMLGGKTVSHKVVEATLKRNGRISPETCGWHYIEGLRDDDDSQIMVAWDKAVGLWHNGERSPKMMHEVIHVDGWVSFVSKDQWPQVIADEKKKLAELSASRGSNAPPIRWSDEESLGPNPPLRK